MTLATRCPVCQALFRVSPEQLRARTGQVRCGRCHAIFDGLAHLVSDTGRATALVPAIQDTAAPAVTTEAAPAATPPIAPPASSAAAGFVDVFAPTPPRPSVLDRLREQWKTIAVSVLLLVLLLLQLALRQRDMLAAEHPALRGALVALCGIVGCEVRLPRAADRLAIEGDEMVADTKEPSRVTLIATLRNSAEFPVAYPALEVTLQNAQDEILARRVLGPADYLPAGSDPAQGLAAQGEVNLRLALDTGSMRAEGYRLFLFYP